MADCVNCESINGYNTVNQCITNGVRYQDQLSLINNHPDLRKDVVLAYSYANSGIDGVIQQLQSTFGLEKRMVDTWEYYWAEICKKPVQTFNIDPVATVGAAGAAVVTTISSSKFVPRVGRYVYLKELKQQQVKITAATLLPSGKWQVTLQPINGQVLDLTGSSCFTAIMSPMDSVDRCNEDCVSPEGLQQTFPTIRKGYMSKFEKAICRKACHLDGTGDDNKPRFIQPINPRTGERTEYWTNTAINNEILNAWKTNRALEIMFSERDDVAQKKFDGLVKTFEQKGQNVDYNKADGASFRAYFMNMVRNLRRTGSNFKNWFLLGDYQFGLTWGESLNSYLANQGCNSPVIMQKNGDTLSWDWMKNLSIGDFNVMFKELDFFSSYDYGLPKEDFAILFPKDAFTNSEGQRVSPINIVGIKGAEEATMNGTVSMDTTKWISCEEVSWVLRDTFGLEIHCACHAGVFHGTNC